MLTDFRSRHFHCFIVLGNNAGNILHCFWPCFGKLFKSGSLFLFQMVANDRELWQDWQRKVFGPRSTYRDLPPHLQFQGEFLEHKMDEHIKELSKELLRMKKLETVFRVRVLRPTKNTMRAYPSAQIQELESFRLKLAKIGAHTTSTGSGSVRRTTLRQVDKLLIALAISAYPANPIFYTFGHDEFYVVSGERLLEIASIYR